MIKVPHEAGWFIDHEDGTIGDWRRYETEEEASDARDKRAGRERLRVVYKEKVSYETK